MRRGNTFFLLCCCLVASSHILQAKQITDSDRKIRAQQALEKTHKTLLSLYKNKGNTNQLPATSTNTNNNAAQTKPAEEASQTPVSTVPNSNVVDANKTPNAVMAAATNQNMQPIEPSAPKKPGRVISKNPKEEKQKKERFVQF